MVYAPENWRTNPRKETMAIEKMEWQKDYKTLRIEMFSVPDRTGGLKRTEECQASSELVEYKKGQTINVEQRDRTFSFQGVERTLFHDVDNDIFFTADDSAEYRLSRSSRRDLRDFREGAADAG
jgi:hypothetical protein